MDATSSQPKRKRLTIDRRDAAIFFVLTGIFFIIVRSNDILRLLLPEMEIASPLAEFIVLLAAFLWLAVIVLLARYAKLLHRKLTYLLVIPYIGAFIYFFSTYRSSDSMGYPIFNVISGILYLTLAPIIWLEHKLDKQAATTAWNYKPWLRALIVVLGLIVVWNSTYWMVYPSRFRLCRDVAEYVSLQECMALENNLAIVQRAFPVGKATVEQVNSALGKYLHAKGHNIDTGEVIQSYGLSVTPMDLLNHSFDDYNFYYDKNGVLKSLRYTDF